MRNEIRYQRNQRWKKKKEEFFATINVLEIQNQLIDSFEYCVSFLFSSFQHYLLKRTRLTCKLFESSQSFSHSEQTMLLRLLTLYDFIQLCVRQKSRRSKIQSRSQFRQKKEIYSIRCAVRICLFCLSNVILSRQYRQRNFNSDNRLAKHFENQHYMLLRRDLVSVDQISCSHSVCSNILESISHFQNHAAKMHEIRFTRNCDQSAMTD